MLELKGEAERRGRRNRSVSNRMGSIKDDASREISSPLLSTALFALEYFAGRQHELSGHIPSTDDYITICVLQSFNRSVAEPVKQETRTKPVNIRLCLGQSRRPVRIYVPEECLDGIRTPNVRFVNDNEDGARLFIKHTVLAVLTLESIQHTTFHSVPWPSFFGTATPSGVVSRTSGVLDVPRSLRSASVSKETPFGSRIRGKACE